MILKSDLRRGVFFVDEQANLRPVRLIRHRIDCADRTPVFVRSVFPGNDVTRNSHKQTPSGTAAGVVHDSYPHYVQDISAAKGEYHLFNVSIMPGDGTDLLTQIFVGVLSHHSVSPDTLPPSGTRYPDTGRDIDSTLNLLKDNVLSTVPENLPAQTFQVFPSLDDGKEMVPGKLPHFAGKIGWPIRQENLRFTESAGIKKDLSGRRIARGILDTDIQFEVSQGNPARLSAPSRMDELFPLRHQLMKCFPCPGSTFLLGPRNEFMPGNYYLYFHCRNSFDCSERNEHDMNRRSSTGR